MYSYKKIVKIAKEIRKNVQSKQKLGRSTKWSYYIAKAILNPNKDIKKINDLSKAFNPQQSKISRTVKKSDYLALIKQYVEFVELNHRLPNYIIYDAKKIKPRVFTYVFAKILRYYAKYNKLPDSVNISHKVFQPKVETNEVYDYFVKTFGSFDNTIDGALAKVQDRGYSYYYDDLYTNKQSIDRIKAGKGINCTDSCHVFYNIMKQLIAFGKYKKVECLHVMCSSGGHVKLRITLNDGTKIIRDPACVLSDNGKGVTCVWCTNTPIAVDPSWFMECVNR